MIRKNIVPPALALSIALGTSIAAMARAPVDAVVYGPRTLRVNDAVAEEGNKLDFVVTANRPLSVATDVQLMPSDMDAIGHSSCAIKYDGEHPHYINAPVLVTIPAGQTQAIGRITTCKNRFNGPDILSLRVTMIPLSNVGSVEDGEAIGMIISDDHNPENMQQP